MSSQVKNFLKEFGTVVILSLVIVLPIRIFIAQPFVVSGQSMDNTFHNANYLIIDEISYRFEEPKRGDVIVFKVPETALKLQNYPLNKKVFYIKRIIGLPGETVQIDGDTVKIYNASNTKGFILEEPYANIDTSLSSPFSNIHEKVTLTDTEYFVMGDNRHNSSDSRVWGPLERKNIQGRTFIRLFPVTEISVFPGEYNEYQVKN